MIGIKDFENTFSNIDEKDRDGQIEAYDRILNECKDALQLTKDDMRSDAHAKSTGKMSAVCCCFIIIKMLHNLIFFKLFDLDAKKSVLIILNCIWALSRSHMPRILKQKYQFNLCKY